MMLQRSGLPKVLLAVMLLAAGVTLSGCGGAAESKKKAGVTISVTYNGAPVTEGDVRLMMTGKGEGAAGPLNESGQVELQEVVLGKYNVAVTPPEGTPDNPAPQKEYPNIPTKFRNVQASPLQADVKAGTNEFTFELKE
ncbi:hypothetical protein [Gimesia panareensis]|uniref:hypothetical protein n=1 Tax=Gimesia panareensis TaxID=2527978 RepID=UPI00118A5A0F|nr:hypothetical protein [Gimesia panareensis]QDU53429.1 hypothetical protein Pan110_58210 [Gimesia panareensis]